MDRRWLRLQAAAVLLCVRTVLMLRMCVCAQSGDGAEHCKRAGRQNCRSDLRRM